MSGVTDWYDEVLFREGRNGRPPSGAAHLLGEKIARVRSGKTDIPREVVIIPVVVVPDETLFNVAIGRRMMERSTTVRSLKGAGVRPLLLCSLDEYEALMGLASYGKHLGELLDKKQSGEWVWQRLDAFLWREVSDHTQFRLKQIQDRFEAVGEGAMTRLRAEAKIPPH